MPDDLLDRVADDLASGRPVDWTAVMASAASASERAQLESLRLVNQIATGDATSTRTASVTDDPVTGPAAVTGAVAPAAVWGRYVLVHEAGSGGFGTVYRAMDPAIHLDIAIKVLHRYVDNEVLRRRLLKEGGALARIRHQNVVRVLGVEFNGDAAGLCTEFIHGETLDAEVRRHGTFSEAQAIEVGKAVCQGLAAVHRAGFIHRDVKARNVMRERDTGRIVLMDLGTGRELEQEEGSPRFGIEGTAIYMAPEVLAGQRATPAGDVYSAGVLLYYVLTGAYPVEGMSVEHIKSAHLQGLRTPLGERRPDLSPAFLRVVQKALAPEASRYATPAALCDDLEAVGTARPRWVQWLRNATAAALISLGSVIVLGFINTVYFNAALGRAGFVDEGVRDWLTWGAKGILAPVIIAAFTVLALTLLLECVQLLTRISALARKAEHATARAVHRYSLDQVAVLASISLLSSATALFAAWWYFTPLLSTLTSIVPDIATVSFERLALLSPDFGDYHLLYRKTFVATTLACVLLWYPTVRLSVRTRQRLPRRPLVGGAIVLAFSLILLDFPYRLLSHDIDFDEVTWEGRSCHVLGARADERLVFCPSLPVPRSRVVRAGALTPLHGSDLEPFEAGSVKAKRKKSIFKFLLHSPRVALEGRLP